MIEFNQCVGSVSGSYDHSTLRLLSVCLKAIFSIRHVRLATTVQEILEKIDWGTVHNQQVRSAHHVDAGVKIGEHSLVQMSQW